ncbi:MAG TPA: hypothetical protein VIC26_16710 [Marinagarivorans sp.]
MSARLWWALMFCTICSTATAKEEPLSSVADLRYGVALYHYYQDQHFLALSDLLVAKERGGIQGHGDNPEIMMGGFYMAYGLERTASDVFERLLDGNRPQKTRDAAWLYLAKMRYLRGDLTAAHEALNRVSAEPVGVAADEIDALKVNLLLKENRLEQARAIVDEVDRNDDNAPYLYFNMAAAYARNQDYAQAVTFYNRIAQMRQRTEAHLSLYDKAMTAAGFAHLYNQQNDLAAEQFKRVRLDGPYSSRALLGFGWAQLEGENYRAALTPWQALSKRKLIDENTQEAMVAIPYAYEKMDLKSAALQKYREAEAGFEAELATLDIYMQSLRGEAMLASLNIDPSEDINWLDYAQSSNLAPQLTYLTELFSRNAFRGLIQELRDLLDLKRRLVEWQGRMNFYNDMLLEREANRILEMDFMAQQQAYSRLDALSEERADIFRYLADIEKNNDFTALLQGNELSRLERIERAERNITLLEAAGEDVTEAKEKVRRHRGLLEWQSGQFFAERLWRGRKTLVELDQNIQNAKQTQARIQTQVANGDDLTPYRNRIDDARQRVEAQLVLISDEIDNAQEVLRGEVANVLDEQRGRLRYYLAQSRLAIARLLDEADGEDY